MNIRREIVIVAATAVTLAAAFLSVHPTGPYGESERRDRSGAVRVLPVVLGQDIAAAQRGTETPTPEPVSFTCPAYTVRVPGEGVASCADPEVGMWIASIGVTPGTYETPEQWIEALNPLIAPYAEEVVLGEMTIDGERGVLTYQRALQEIEPPGWVRSAQKSVYVVRKGVLYEFSIRSDTPENRKFFESVRFGE
jgi:hypothetical protein